MTPTAADPVAALERALLPGLLRPPCLVSFSGGLDSSLVLAVADRLALREGLARPVPATLRFRGAPSSREDEAQHAVVEAVGSPDWHVGELDDEAHLLGPLAVRALQRHGVLQPANAFFHLPLLDLAEGGTLLTGIGGDQVLGGWRRPPRRRRPWWSTGRVTTGRGSAHPFAWLRAGPARVARRHLASERSAQPHDFADRVRWHRGRRDLVLSLQSMDRLASDAGCATLAPLTDPGFCAALASRGGASGFGPSGLAGRPQLLSGVFGELHPDVVAGRPKATFNQVFWRQPTLDFLRSWDGGGVDESLVSIPRLRAEWARPQPAFLTAKLAQQVWLAGQGLPTHPHHSPQER